MCESLTVSEHRDNGTHETERLIKAHTKDRDDIAQTTEEFQ